MTLPTSAAALKPAVRAFAGLLLVLTPIASAGELDRIGQGDPRGGYQSSEFQTHSRTLLSQTGIPADLAGLAADPPLGLPELMDPPSQALIDLGRKLFFDRRLSNNGTLSCGMCHVPEQAFTQNEMATPVGIEGRFVRRNAPSLYNVGYRRVLFVDARETELSRQIWAPLLAENEMGNPSRSAVLTKVADDDAYADAFAQLFDEGLNERTLGLALAGYQRSLLAANSPFDRWFYGGDSGALEDGAKRGFAHFHAQGCTRCHRLNNAYAHFTDDASHRTGVGYRSHAHPSELVTTLQIAPGVSVDLHTPVEVVKSPDEGLKEVTGAEGDLWRYRTPSLRNVAITAPYMHDGSLTTLEAVIDFYNDGGGADPDKDLEITALHLNRTEKAELKLFLEALTAANVDALAADARSAPIGDFKTGYSK